jgi:hypothetical protein
MYKEGVCVAAGTRLRRLDCSEIAVEKAWTGGLNRRGGMTI